MDKNSLIQAVQKIKYLLIDGNRIQVARIQDLYSGKVVYATQETEISVHCRIFPKNTVPTIEEAVIINAVADFFEYTYDISTDKIVGKDREENVQEPPLESLGKALPNEDRCDALSASPGAPWEKVKELLDMLASLGADPEYDDFRLSGVQQSDVLRAYLWHDSNDYKAVFFEASNEFVALEYMNYL